MNKPQAELLGVRDPEAVVGKTDFDFFSPEVAREFCAEDQKIIKAGQPLIGKIEHFHTPHGREVWFLCTETPVKSKDGQVTGIVGISRDITQLKRAEEALRNGEERFRLLMRATNDWVWEWDVAIGAAWWNDAVCSLFGYFWLRARSRSNGVRLVVSTRPPVRGGRVLSRQWALTNSGENLWSGEYRFRRADGRYADVFGGHALLDLPALRNRTDERRI